MSSNNNNRSSSFGSHIDDEGNIQFVRPAAKKDKSQMKEESIYGIYSQSVQESIFNGTKQLSKATLAMNFRKSEVVQHNPDTGIKITQAIAKSNGGPPLTTFTSTKKIPAKTANFNDDEDEETPSIDEGDRPLREKPSKKGHASVTFDEKNLIETKKKPTQQQGLFKQSFSFNNQDEENNEDDDDDDDDDGFQRPSFSGGVPKPAEPAETGQGFFRSMLNKQPEKKPSEKVVLEDQLNDIDDLSSGNEKDDEEKEGDVENSDEDNEEDDDEEDEGFGGRRKRKTLFYKSSKTKKSILKKPAHPLKKGGAAAHSEDEEDEETYSKKQAKNGDSESRKVGILHLTKEQQRKKRIYNFKNQIDQDDEDMILEEQQRLLNLPMNFGMQRKQMRKNNANDSEEEIDPADMEEYYNNPHGSVGKNAASAEATQKMTEDFGKGFKMLQKMGYKAGQGMGKFGQGRTQAVEAVNKNSFTLHDNMHEIENNYRKMLRDEFQIDVESDLDQLEKDLINFKSLDSSQYDLEGQKGDDDDDDDDANELELQKTYVSRKEQSAQQSKQSRFPNRFFAYLDKKGRQAKRRRDNMPDHGEKPTLAGAGQKSTVGQGSIGKIVDMRGSSAVSFTSSAESNGYADFFSFNRMQSAQGNSTNIGTAAAFKNLAKQQAQLPAVLSDIVYSLKNKLAKIHSRSANLSSKLRIESDRIVTVEYEQTQLQDAAAVQTESSNETVSLLRQLREILNEPKPLSAVETLLAFEKIVKSAAKPFVNFSIEQLFVKSIADSLARDLITLSQERKATRIACEEFESEEMPASKSVPLDCDINRDDAKMATAIIERAEHLITNVLLSRQNSGIESYEHELQKGIHLQRDTKLDEANSRLLNRYVQYIANNSFMPQLKNYMMKTFLPSDLLSNNQLIDCVEIYSHVLPQAVVQDLLTTLVIPKLNAAVKKWQVTKKKVKATEGSSQISSTTNNEDSQHTQDAVNIDLWLLPWMSVVSPIDQLKETFKLVMAKYSQALQKWEVEDMSMLEKLLPWKAVISTSQWNDLMFKQVIPKLSYFLETFEINPSEQQGLDVIESVVQWCAHLSDGDICNIMEDTVLVKIAEILVEWIDACSERAVAAAEANAGQKRQKGGDKDGDDDEDDDDDDLGGVDAGFNEIEEWLRGWEILLGDKIMAIPSFSISFDQFFQKIEAAS